MLTTTTIQIRQTTTFTFIFNLSFTSGQVPDLFKIANVVPVYKKEKNLPGNY